jgi:hypothetical protein
LATPTLARGLETLRANFNVRFPTRDKTTDGWIGDAAHQTHVSGHNPDDTPGSLAESSDADTKPEVRAIDVDKDLRDPEYTMLQVIQNMLKHPEDLKRLLYIIHKGIIWAKSRGWAPAQYTGSNSHDEHAHLSGDPLYDEDTSPWSVLTIGKDDDMTPQQAYIQHVLNYRLEALISGKMTYNVPAVTIEGQAFPNLSGPNVVATDLNEIQGGVGEIKTRVTAIETRLATIETTLENSGGNVPPADLTEIKTDIATIKESTNSLVGAVKAAATAVL